MSTTGVASTDPTSPTTAPPPSTSATTAVTTDPSGGSTSDGYGSSTGEVNACVAEEYLEIEFCFGEATPDGSCGCDAECRSYARERALEQFGWGSCDLVFDTLTCASIVMGECCFTATMYEDFCGGKGRPLFIEGQARVADLEARPEWTTPMVRTTSLGAEVRAHIADHWLRAGLEEHASVASFARFALELMAVGAPPKLLADAAAAMRDEVRHAQLAFGLAARFGAPELGPGPLEATSRPVTLESVLLATIREGCVGETLAAAEAELAARRASDPMVASALEEIAADEARHAALAWRFVQWALDEAPDLRDVAEQAFAAALALDVAPTTDVPEGLEAYGVLAPATVAMVRAKTLQDTVQPCAHALLNPPRDPELAAQA